MFELKEREILEEMQSLELQLIIMQRELARSNPELTKAMFKVSSKVVDLMSFIDLDNLIKLHQCSNRTILGLPSAEFITKLGEGSMEFLSLDCLTDKN